MNERPIDDRVRERIKKIKALAERGVGGEKVNAERMLRAMLDKHNISESELAEDVVETHWIKHGKKTFESKLLYQIIHAVCGHPKLWRNKKKRYVVGVDCTKYQAIEIEMKLNIYRAALADHIELAYEAFINVNGIFHPDAQGSDEDFDMGRMEKLINLMSGVSKTDLPTGLLENTNPNQTNVSE